MGQVKVYIYSVNQLNDDRLLLTISTLQAIKSVVSFAGSFELSRSTVGQVIDMIYPEIGIDELYRYSD